MNSVVMQAEDMNFDVRDLEIIYRRVVMILSNVYNYFEMYADETDWKIGGKNSDEEETSALDKWILVRLEELIKE